MERANSAPVTGFLPGALQAVELEQRALAGRDDQDAALAAAAPRARPRSPAGYGQGLEDLDALGAEERVEARATA